MKKIFLIFAALITASAAAQSESFFTVDTHCDTPYLFYTDRYDLMADNPGACIDVAKMRRGGLDGAFFAAFVSQGGLDKESLAKKSADVMRLLTNIHRMAAEHPADIAICTTPAEGYRAKAEGKIAMFVGVENGTGLGGDIDNVDRWAALGVRYITLVHSRNNDLCDSANDTVKRGGLTDFGRDVIRRMNRAGVMVDLSHADEQSAAQAARLSTKPCIASHSSAAGVHANARNMSDTLIRLVAERGGVVQVCLLSDYLKAGKSSRPFSRDQRELLNQYPSTMSTAQRADYEAKLASLIQKHKATLADVADAADHVDYIVALVGIDHVGIGSDFDGGGFLNGYMHAGEAHNLTAELRRRGYSEEQLAKIWSGNVFRVLNAQR